MTTEISPNRTPLVLACHANHTGRERARPNRSYRFALAALFFLATPSITTANVSNVRATGGVGGVSLSWDNPDEVFIVIRNTTDTAVYYLGPTRTTAFMTDARIGQESCYTVNYVGPACATARARPVVSLTVTFGAATYTATERGAAAEVTIQLQRDSNRSVEIPLVTDPITGNFTAPATVSFASGDISTTITVTADADNNFTDETVALSFGTLPTGVSAGTQATTTVTLTDAGPAALTATFGAPTYVASEGEASVAVSVRLDPAADRPVVIPLVSNPPTGNFTTPTSVSFSTGDTSQTVTVSADADDNFENESVDLSFGTLPTGVSAGSHTTATIHLLDADRAELTVSFGASAYTATEGGGAAPVTIRLNKAADRPLVIALIPDPASGNFTTPTTVSFSTGDTSQTVTVRASIDTNFDNESVRLSFGTLPDGVSAGTLTSTTIALTDAGHASLTVSFATSTYTATERGAAALVSVILDQAADRAVAIPLRFNPTSGHFTTPATVSFSTGDTSQTVTVRASIDTNLDNESVRLSFGTLPDGVSAGSQATTTVTLADFGATDLSLDASAITVTEGATAALGVSLSRSFPEQVTFQWSTANGTAAGGSDYTAQTTTSVTFAPGETAKTLYIPTTDDTTAEADETFTVSIAAPNHPLGVRLGTDEVTVTITNDDSATLALTASTTTTREGSPANLTVSLSRAVSDTVTFSWSTADGTAQEPGDYTAQTTTSVSFAPGETAKHLRIETTSDSTAEADETFTVSITASNLPAGVSLGTAHATVTITNDDSVSLALAAAAISVTEGTAATLTVSLSNPVSETVTFSWSTADGTAQATDYTAQTATSVSFTAGQTSKTLSVTTTGDSTVEPYETFTVSITASNLPAGVSLGLAATTVTISNDDSASITLAASTLSITEGTAATLTVSLSNPVSDTVTFSWSTADGTAAAGDDYTAQTATSVSFTAGQTSKTLSVPTTGDTIVESDETFSVSLAASNLPAGVSLGLAVTTVTISNDDIPQVDLSLSTSTLSVPEGATANLTVSLSRAALEAVTFSWSTADGTATAGNDYTAQPTTTISIARGQRAATLAVRTTDDTTAEPAETFTVSIAAPNLPAGVSLGTTQAIVTITNDDIATLALSPSTSVAEGATANFTASLSRAVSQTVTFTWSTADGSATAGDDYTEQTTTSVTFNAGDTTHNLSVTTADDSTVEPHETFTVSITAPNLPAGVTLRNAQATVTITNDDSASLALTAPTLTLTEGAIANLTVSLSNPVSEPITFTWSTADGTATAGDDYTAQTSTSVSIASAQTTTTLSIPTTPETTVESDETFSVSLAASNLPDGVSLGIAVTTITITNDDIPQVDLALTTSTLTLTEGATANLTVELSKAALETVTFSWSTADGTATAGDDYTAQTTTSVSLAPGQRAATLAIPTAADTNVESDETFTVSIAASDLPAGVTLRNAQAAVTITNDDTTLSTLALGASAIAVAEGTTASLTVSLTRAVLHTVTFTWSTTDGTAQATDYTAQPPTSVSFAPNETSKTLTIATSSDSTVEPHETFTVSIAASNLPDGISLGTAQATVTITNDDSANLGLAASTLSVTEGATASLTVSLSNPVSQTVSFTWSTSGGTAAAGDDYTAATATPVSFAPNETSKTLSVPTTTDTTIEPDETFNVSLAASTLPAGVSLGIAVTTVTITNDDIPEVEISLSTVTLTVTEGATANLTVELSQAALETVTFSWSTADGTAAAGDDYTAQTSTSVSFAPGQRAVTLAIPTAADTTVESDETFTVSLAVPNLPAGVTLGTAQTTVTITNDDTTLSSLALSVSALSVAEGTTATLTVSLTRAVNQPVTFTWNTTDGTAAAATDYTAQPATTVSFAPTETTKTLTIPTTTDTTVEPHETFTVSLAASNLPDGVTLGTAQATVTIANDDSASLALAASTLTVTEGAAATLAVSLSNPVSQPISLTWSTADGTATAGDDYTAHTATPVNLAPGQRAATFAIPTTADTTVERDETFTVSIAASNLPIGVSLGIAVTTVTITNDDIPQAELSLTTPSLTVTEGTTANLTVELSRAALETVTFSWSTADGSATAGSDYTAQTTTTVSLTPGQRAATLAIPTTPDSAVEDDETFTVSIAASSFPTGVTLGTAQATVTIQDDDSDQATLSFSASVTSVTEGDTTNLTVSLSNPVSEPISFTWSTADGTADAGDDYTAQPTTSVSIPAGQTATTLSVPTRDDTTVEPRETFTVSIAASSLPTGVSLGIALTTVTITDNDTAVATLALTVSALTVTEGATAHLTVSLSRSLLETAIFQWSTASGTASAGSDYTAQTATAVSFAPGETAKTLSVSTTGDSAVEPDETFTVSIAATALPTGVTLGTDEATVTIQDDDDDRVSLSLTTSAVAVTEGDAANLTVQLSRAVTDTVSFTWSTADGSASAGADYTPQPVTTVSFAPGETAKILSVLTTTDLTVEPDETFSVSVTPADLSSTIRLGTTLATVTIQDGDAARLAFAASAISVAEGATAHLTVELSRAATETVTFTWSTADQTTIAGSDYTAQTTTAVSFAPGETSTVLSVATRADFIPEPDETFIVSLAASSLPAGVSLGIAVAIVTIEDGDDAIGAPLTLRILEDNLTALEGGPPIDIHFLLEPPTDRPLAIPLVTAPLHGLTTIDHPPLPPTVTFQPNQDRATTTVLALSDHDDDPDEALLVSLGDLPAGVTLIGPDSVLITFRQPGPRETLVSSLPVLLATVARSISATGQAAVETRLSRKRQQHANHVRRRYDSPISASPFSPPTDPSAPPDVPAPLQHPFFVDDPAGPALWGTATLTQFSGNPATSSVDYQGRLWSAHVGLDLYSGATTLVGLAFSKDSTDVQYTAAHYTGGSLQAQLHTVRPYAYWQPTSRFALWTTVAGGAGRVSATLDDTDIDNSKIRFDSFSLGSDAVLFTRNGTALRLRADAFATQLTATGSDLPSQLRGRASQARLLLDWTRDTPVRRGSDLRLQFQSGARYDRGDADRGLGAESTARIAYLDPRAGFDISLFARTLLAHRDGYRDSGFGLQASWDPGSLGLGWHIAVTAGRGDAATGRTIAWDDPTSLATGTTAGTHLETDLAYGLLLPRRNARLTWYTNLSTLPPRHAFRAGAKVHLFPAEPRTTAIQLDLGAAHTRGPNSLPDYALFLRLSLPL